MRPWDIVNFGDLFLEPVKNGVYKSAEFQGTGINIVNMKELFAFEFIGSQEMRKIQLDDNEKKRFLLKDGDLLFARRSIVESGSGKTSIIRHLTGEMTFESSIIRLRLNQKLSVPLFYYYYLSADKGRASIVALSSGTNVKGIRGSDLQNVKVPAPELSVQRKIASILSAYDDLIENNLKRIRLLEEMSQRVFNNWYSVNRWRESNLGATVGYEIGGGWGEEIQSKDFNDAAFVIRGTDIDKLLIGELGNVPFRYHKKSNLASRKLENGDIVFEVSGGSNFEGVAKTLLITNELLSQFNDDVMCASFCKLLRPVKLELSNFIFLYLRFLREIRATEVFEIRSASNIVNYNWTAFLKFQKVKLPDDRSLMEFNRIIDPIYDQVYKLAHQNRLLKEARDILLPRLMSGAINAERSEVDELAMAAEPIAKYKRG